jgi:hypothetical protein
MNVFLLNKIQYFIDRSHEYSMLLKYITGNHKDFMLIEHRLDTQSDSAKSQPLLALSSQSGDGKTMLLAKFVIDIEVSSKQDFLKFISTLISLKERMKDKAIIYYHFTDGAYQDGTHFILTNLKRKLLKHLGE